MAEAKARSYSRPVFDQQVILQSEQAQRVYEREFRRVVEALYAIDVILRIIGDSQEADTVESMVTEMIAECANEIKNEQARFDKLKEDNGITAIPRYTHPGQVQIRIVSPQAAQFAALLRNMDALMISLDTLWLCGVMGNKQRGNGVYQWQQRLLRLGRRIVDIEKRARFRRHGVARLKKCGRRQGICPMAKNQMVRNWMQPAQLMGRCPKLR